MLSHALSVSIRGPQNMLVTAACARRIAAQRELSMTRNASSPAAGMRAICRCACISSASDVLEKRKRGWRLVEVKATLDVKEQFLPDVAVQLYAARAAGVDVRGAELMHLNRECTTPTWTASSFATTSPTRWRRSSPRSRSSSK